MIQQMEKSQKGGTAEKALFNAIANNNIDDLVKKSCQCCCRGYSFQYRDSAAVYPQPVEFRPLLDVQRFQCAPL